MHMVPDSSLSRVLKEKEPGCAPVIWRRHSLAIPPGPSRPLAGLRSARLPAGYVRGLPRWPEWHLSRAGRRERDSAKQPLPPAREKESKRRRIIGIIVSIVIAGVVISGGIVGYVHYVNLNKPWREPIVEVNGEVYDMDYFVKVLRLYQVDQ